MANTLAPFGFAVRGIIGAPYTGELIERKIAAADTTKIYQGDPVKSLNTGYVAQWTAGVAASQLAGIFVGCRYVSSIDNEWKYSKFWPGGSNTGDAIALLVPCSGAVAPIFRVQSSGTVITLADIGANADVSIGTGSTATGQSGATLDQSTLNTTATLPFRIVGLYAGVDNGGDHTTSYNHVIVVANVTGAGATGI